MIRVNPLALILILGLLGGCGQPVTPESKKGLEPYTRADKTKSDRKAQMIFSRPLSGINSREHYNLELELAHPPAEVTLHSHFNGYAYRDGMQIRLKVRADKTAEIEVSSPGLPPRKSEWPAAIGDDGRVALRIEVHDGGRRGSRVLIWRENISYLGEAENPRPRIHAKNADLDTQALGWTFLSHGRGVFWGLETQNVRVLRAQRETPYVD